MTEHLGSAPHPEGATPPVKIWYCKIGETAAGNVPQGGDFPMRRAIEKEYHEITGEWPEFIFSGWGAELTESERAVVENRQPGPHDDKGFSEEKCLRCGWVMGQSPLNCQNDDTPHVFPSQQRFEEQASAGRSSGEAVSTDWERGD